MSYCMFENTYSALKQVRNYMENVESLESMLEEASSSYEKESMEKLYELILDVKELYDNFYIEAGEID